MIATKKVLHAIFHLQSNFNWSAITLDLGPPCDNLASTVRRAVDDKKTPGVVVLSHTVESNYLDALAILGAALLVVAVIFVTIRKVYFYRSGFEFFPNNLFSVK
jgi:hypothetical protein